MEAALRRIRSHLVAQMASCSAAIALSLPGNSLAQTDRLPNLVAKPAADIQLVRNFAITDGWTLRFSTTSWNSGTGPLELVAGEIETGNTRRKVYQRVYLSDGSSFQHYAGSFVYHPEHNHFHFERYATYTLQPVNSPGASQRSGAKTTFCVMDTDKVNGSLPGAPISAVYASCGNAIQGMSVGWGDTYGSHLAGQELDFTGNPDGTYQLRIDVDPNTVLLETTRSDNGSCVLIDIARPNVTVLDSSGACGVALSITPNSARANSQVAVTISGYGFKPGMAVSFENGNGPRPVASNVALIEDTATVDRMTATVTVPYKKNLGRDPVWDLRVGTAGVLPDAFTVTR